MPRVVEEDLPVVRGGEARGLVAEAHHLATGFAGGAEPGLHGERLRCRGGVLRGDLSAVAVEGDRGVLHSEQRTVGAQRVASRVGAVVPGRSGVERGVAARLAQAPVQLRGGVEHRPSVVVDRRFHPDLPGGGRVVRGDAGRAQGTGVDRELVQGTHELGVGRGGGPPPGGAAIGAEPPVSDVGLGVGDVGPLADDLPVDVQAHGRTAQGHRRLVPLAVVVPGRGRHPLVPTGAHVEDQPPVLEVDLPVLATGLGVDEVTEPEHPAGRLTGAEPRLGSELGRRVVGAGGRHPSALTRGRLESRGALEDAGLAARLRAGGRSVPTTGVVRDRAAGGLVQRPVQLRVVGQDLLGVLVLRDLVGNGHVPSATEEVVAVGVPRPQRVAVLLPRSGGVVHEVQGRHVPPVRWGLQGAHHATGAADHLVGQLPVVTIVGGTPADLDPALGRRL